MSTVEITNMVMVQDPITKKVVAQERVKNWCGIAFPGGHVEGESIYDSAIREVWEETGLKIKNLKACGFMHWYNNETEDRYFTYFFKTCDYEGTLIEKTDEGRVFWTDIEALLQMDLAPNFKEYLKMFIEENHSEAFCSWNEKTTPKDTDCENPWGIIFK